MTVIRNCSHTCAPAAYTSCGYYSRAAFNSFRASDGAATIRGRRLFEEVRHIPLYKSDSMVASMCRVYLLHVLISGVHCPQALESLKNLERFAYSVQFTSCMLLCCSTVVTYIVGYCP